MKCVIVVGLYHWCLIDIPSETPENTDSLQRLRDEEFEQNLEIEADPGIYQVEFFALEDSELEYRNLEYLLPVLP